MNTSDYEGRLEIGAAGLARHADEALEVALGAVLESGHEVPGQRPSREIMSYSLQVVDPRDRVLANDVRPLGITTAVARTVWMLAGNDRFADIYFYERKVARFSDDGLIVPGSSYGRRLLRPRPGVNQIEGAIGRLRGTENEAEGHPDRKLRRAAAVIWEPEDAVRASNDIPCAFGVFFHARNGQLVTTLCMRSSNATLLLPWNLFEFSILAEIVAAECDLALGPLVIWAASMHVYDDERRRAEDALASARQLHGSTREPMDPMPSEPSPMEQARLLAELEAALRHELPRLADETDDDLLARGAALHPWWLAMYRVLLVRCLMTVGRPQVAIRLTEVLPSYFRKQVRDEHATVEVGAPSSAQLRLIEGGLSEDGIALASSDPWARLLAIIETIERDENRELRRREYEALRYDFVDAAAARDGDFDRADVESVLRRFRQAGDG